MLKLKPKNFCLPSTTDYKLAWILYNNVNIKQNFFLYSLSTIMFYIHRCFNSSMSPII